MIVRFDRGLVGVFGLALLSRAAHQWAVASSAIGGVLVQDARFYHEEALRLLGAIPRPLEATIPFMNFGYPWILAAVYAVAGPAPAIVLALQAVVAAATAVVLALAVRDVSGDDRAGLLAGFLYAAYAPAIFYDGLLLTPSLTNASLAICVFALLRAARRRSLLLATGAGLALGAAILLRANVLPLVPVFAAACWAGTRDRRGLMTGLLVAAAALAPAAAVTIANGAAHDQWVPVTANGGMNLWVGNNRHAEGIYFAAPFLGNRGAEGEESAFLAEARRRTGRGDLTLAGSSAFWTRETLREIAAGPARWGRLIARKGVASLSGVEAKTNVSIPFVEHFSPVLRWTPVRWVWLAPLGCAGLFLLGRRSRGAWIFGALAATALLTCVAFFVSGEYRHPAALAWCAGAGVALVALPALARAPRRAIAPASIAAAFFAVAAWPQPALERAFPASLDVRSFVRSLGVPLLDGSPPTHADLERAARILAAAPAATSPDIYYLDTRMWLAWRTTAIRGDAGAAAAAFDDARAIRSYRPEPGDRSEEAAYLPVARDAVAARVRDLAATDVVKSDPGLSRRAALAGGNGWFEIPAAVARGDVGEARAFADAALAEAPGEARLIELREHAGFNVRDR